MKSKYPKKKIVDMNSLKNISGLVSQENKAHHLFFSESGNRKDQKTQLTTYMKSHKVYNWKETHQPKLEKTMFLNRQTKMPHEPSHW